MSRGVVFVIFLALAAVVLGALVLIGVIRGDDTSVDDNGVNGSATSTAGPRVA